MPNKQLTIDVSARDQGASAVLNRLNKSLRGLSEATGKKSVLGEFGSLLKGGGAIAGIVGAAATIKSFADATTAFRQSSKDVNKNWADASQSLMQSIPGLSIIEGAGESINEIFTHQKEIIDQHNQGIQFGNELMDQRISLSRQVRDAQFESQQMTSNLVNSARLARMQGVPLQRTTLTIQHEDERTAMQHQFAQWQDQLDDLNKKLAPETQKLAALRDQAGAFLRLSPEDRRFVSDPSALGDIRNQTPHQRELAKRVDSGDLFRISSSQVESANQYDSQKVLVDGLEQQRKQFADRINNESTIKSLLEGKFSAQEAANEYKVNEQRRAEAVAGEQAIADARSQVRVKEFKAEGDDLKANLEQTRQLYRDTVSQIFEDARKQLLSDPQNIVAIAKQFWNDLQTARANRDADANAAQKQENIFLQDLQFSHEESMKQIRDQAHEEALAAEGKNFAARFAAEKSQFSRERDEINHQYDVLLRDHKGSADELKKQRDQALGQIDNAEKLQGMIDTMNAIKQMRPVNMSARAIGGIGLSADAYSAMAQPLFNRESEEATRSRQMDKLIKIIDGLARKLDQGIQGVLKVQP